MTVSVHKPPRYITHDKSNLSIFLAGSIEMGVAEDWQQQLTNVLANVTVFNPRRDDWDSSWLQDKNNINFNEQVLWEHNHITTADIVVFYFDPTTKSPITLLELGYVAGIKKEMYVCCPEGFWRRGNVEMLCEIHNIPLFNTKEDFFKAIIKRCS